MTAVQLELRAHTITPYSRNGLPGADRGVTPQTWWSWRCACGRDPGAEGWFWTSREDDAAYMGWWHQHDLEPWANPLAGKPPMPGRAR